METTLPNICLSRTSEAFMYIEFLIIFSKLTLFKNTVHNWSNIECLAEFQ